MARYFSCGLFFRFPSVISVASGERIWQAFRPQNKRRRLRTLRHRTLLRQIRPLPAFPRHKRLPLPETPTFKEIACHTVPPNLRTTHFTTFL